jgi:hypothetical protein
MDEPGWTRKPEVVVAGGALLLECFGWVVWTISRTASEDGRDMVLNPTALTIFIGPAVALAACAVGVLHGLRWCAVAAAAAVLVLTGFLEPSAVVLVNLVVVGLLVRANARLRGPVGEAGRVARRDPVVLAASGGCAAAAAAAVVWIVVQGWDDVLHPPVHGHFSPLIGIVLRAGPALVLAAAAAGMLRGSRTWAVTAAGMVVIVGYIAAAETGGGIVATAMVVVAMALLVVVGFAGTRLPWPDP